MSRNQSIRILLICITLCTYGCGTIQGEKWMINKGNVVLRNVESDTYATAYWDHVSDILPNEVFHKYVKSLHLFTDGEENEMGGMTSLSDDNMSWEFDIDTYDFDIKNNDSTHIISYSHTIIHEFGHILTLNPEQVLVSDDLEQDDAKGYLTIEGYATHSSYLGKFIKQFWPDSLLTKWDVIDTKSSYKKQQLLLQLYLNNKDQFLTDYAAESPEEDIAESWTFFVILDKQTESLIKHQKVNFFYQFPELVTYRDEIRAKLKIIPKSYLKNYKNSSD